MKSCIHIPNDPTKLKHQFKIGQIYSQILTFMFSLFFSFLVSRSLCSLSPAEFCPQFSNTDCGNCLNNVQPNYTCGYCADTKGCVPGDELGPFIGGCSSWHYTNDDFCKKDSSLEFSKTTRIIIGVFVGVIVVVTFVFWVFIFPKIFQDKSL